MGFVNGGIVVLCACGIAISCYAVYIDEATHRDSSYKPLCDLDEKISCTRALTSKYSKGFGIVGPMLGEDHILNIPNSYCGLLVFPVLLLLGLSSSLVLTTMATLACFVSSVVSAYLVYILTYVINTICLVCFPVHVINLFLLIFYFIKWKRLVSSSTKSRTKSD